MRWFLTPFLAALLLIGPRADAQIPEPEIWFNPHGPAVDLLDMWTDDAPWRHAARKVKVLVLVHWWVRQQTDATLIQILDYAKQHHMMLDLSTEPVARLPTDTCGNEEGYMSPGEMASTVNTLVRLGAALDWVDMDGPVMSGSYDPSSNGCQYSIPDLVNRVTMTMQDVVAAWPSVKIMEIEPLATLQQTPTWRQDESAFHTGLMRQIGRPVLVMQADVQWQFPGWKQAMLNLYSYLHEQNMRFSVIYDANATASNDADWINSVVANWEAVEGELHIVPDAVLFTSWNSFPAHNMPETSPTAQTWLINRYARPRSTIQVQFVGQGAKGKLTTIDGKPIANATVNGFKPGVNFSQPIPATVVSGVVPATAVTAIIGVRINVECGCDGQNDILFGAIAYQETQGGALRTTLSYPTRPQQLNGVIIGGETIGGATVTRLIAEPGQTFMTNSDTFPVTAGAEYQFTVPAATIGGVGWFGNVILIFIDSQGNGTRVTVVPDPGKALTSTAVTAADGTFALPKIPRNVDGPNPVSVEFDGAAGAYRSSIWTPLR